MKIKTAELVGAALDWAVHVADKAVEPDLFPTIWGGKVQFRTPLCPKYSTDPAQAYPIINREGICTKRQLPCSVGYEWNSWQHTKFGNGAASGLTPLIAAMRCYVASKLGEEVDVPEDLA